MTELPVTFATGSVLGIFYIVLGVAASAERNMTEIGLGTGSETSAALGAVHTASRLLVAVRRHGHFSEYVPLSLIPLMLLELGGASRNSLVGLAGVLVVAQLMIAVGIGRGAPNVLRAGCNVLQSLMIAASAGYALVLAMHR